MPVIETTTRTLYKFDELSDEAKEKAHHWYREAGAGDQWWDCVYEDAQTLAGLLGISLDYKHGHAPHLSPAIWFAGFSSQGDGACFEGSYRYARDSVAAVKAHAPQDTELHRIAKGLQDVQRPHFYKLIATAKHRGHYYHSGYMQVEVEHGDDLYRDIGDAEGDVIQLLRDFADWIHTRLEAEWDYLNADEQVDENIVANEYMFTEDGGIA